jgi:hypothetical protein
MFAYNLVIVLLLFLRMLTGLVALESLLELDLSCNCLSEHGALIPILQLSCLNWLSLEGNPLSFHPEHRTRTACHLHDSTATSKVYYYRCAAEMSPFRSICQHSWA